MLVYADKEDLYSRMMILSVPSGAALTSTLSIWPMKVTLFFSPSNHRGNEKGSIVKG